MKNYELNDSCLCFKNRVLRKRDQRVYPASTFGGEHDAEELVKAGRIRVTSKKIDGPEGKATKPEKKGTVKRLDGKKSYDDATVSFMKKYCETYKLPHGGKALKQEFYDIYSQHDEVAAKAALDAAEAAEKKAAEAANEDAGGGTGDDNVTDNTTGDDD